VFINNWCAIMREIGERYDDGCVYYPLNPDFRALGWAAKAGNPGRVICCNPWIWPRFTDFQDYFCGEGYGFLKSHEWLPDDGSGIFK
jgi:hypothetical protein